MSSETPQVAAVIVQDSEGGRIVAKFYEPALFGALRHKQTAGRSEWEYPFAVAGINITFMLIGESLSCKLSSRLGLP